MESLHKIVGSALSGPPGAGLPKKEREWTLMFVGNHGRVVSLNNVKAWLIAAASVLVVALAAATAMLFLYRSAAAEKEELLATLAKAEAQIGPLKSDREILRAQLVVAEAKLEALEGETEASTQGDGGDASADEAGSQGSSGGDPGQQGSENAQSVEVDRFRVSYDQNSQYVKIAFKLTNLRPGAQRASGYIFVVFGGDEVTGDGWLTLPDVPLVSGKPADFNKGRLFTISRFTTIRFENKVRDDPELFRRATVYVFAREGDLILEKDFPVDIERTAS